jgi:hypothetical protein
MFPESPGESFGINYLGISTNEALAGGMKLPDRGSLAVFWTANPESLIGVPLAEMTFLAPVVRTPSERR